jgi:hypothetical protein
MLYMFLLYHDPEAPEDPGIIDRHLAFTDEARGRKAYILSEALQPVETATTVRVRDGRTVTVDGPFAETKEVLGGVYLLDCRDLDDAIAMAAKIPTADGGAVEVRPVFNVPGWPYTIAADRRA